MNLEEQINLTCNGIKEFLSNQGIPTFGYEEKLREEIQRHILFAIQADRATRTTDELRPHSYEQGRKDGYAECLALCQAINLCTQEGEGITGDMIEDVIEKRMEKL